MSLNYFSVIEGNSIDGFIQKTSTTWYKQGIYNNTTMKTESGIDDNSLTGLPYKAYSIDFGVTWNYQISFTYNHQDLSNLDYASSGHTGFAGLNVQNTFTQNNTFSASILTDSIQSINDNLFIRYNSGVYFGATGSDSASATFYVNDIIEARAYINMTDHTIIHVADPTETHHAVTLNYLNNTISGLYPDVYKVMLSGSDTANYLNNKLIQGNGISFNTSTETITVNSNIQSTTGGGTNLFFNGYTAKQLKDSDYIKFDVTDDLITVNFDYSNFSMTTIWQDAVLDFAVLNDIITTSFVGNERYINTSTDGGYVVNSIYEWIDDAWVETIPESGFAIWVNDEDASDDKGYWSFNGSSWVRFGGSLNHNLLSNKDGGDGSVFYHLSEAHRVALLTGLTTNLHYHTSLLDSDSNTIAYGDSNIFYVNNAMSLEGAETSIVFGDTNTGTDITVANIGSVLVVDNKLQANGFDANSNKITSVANPTELTDAVNLYTLESYISTSIIKISDSVLSNTSKTIDSVVYTNIISVKYMYNIVDSDQNLQSGEINIIANSNNIDTNEYGILKIGSDLDLENYGIYVENISNQIYLKVANNSSSLDINVTVIRINIEEN